MVLIVYALLGDDIRLLATNQPADIVFTAMTVICMVVFTAEVILCSLGRDDYFLSFFFMLDIVSTCSLVLDLTEVSEALAGDDEEVENVKGSKTAKIGAKLGRVFKVVRLVRIIKLYKVAYEAKQARLRREAHGEPGEDDEWDEEEAEDVKVNPETRVGKKLSELTTRRVICLVLVMMLVLPLLKVEQAEQFPFSAAYGADLVHESFTRMTAEQPESASLRTAYERTLLQYIYYHSWFTGHANECPFSPDYQCAKMYDSQLFWVGIAAASVDTLSEKVSVARISDASVVNNWEAEQVDISNSDARIYNFGPMPSQVKSSILGARWDESCDTASGKFARLGFSLLREEIDDFNGASVTYTARCPEDLRRVERRKYAPRLQITESEFEQWHFAFYFDTRPFTRLAALYSLGVTAFVCVALLGAAMVFTNDANNLVLMPVESMISKVEKIRMHPLAAMKMADEEFKKEEATRSRTIRFHQKRLDRAQIVNKLQECFGCTPRSQAELMETVVLEKTIVKLGSLLALGFGEAGANIIEHNMLGVDSANVNAMVEGTRVECIIGSVRVRDFSIATEVLQAKVMTFVNQIAEIVHGVVDEFWGFTNKNSGDTFLVIWRTSDLEPPKTVTKMADMSVLAFTRILGAVHRSPILAAYRAHPGLQQRLGRDCRVNLSCGLHYGWAIEGAVGSEFKIEASYLSPNVSIAESIERATHLIYGVNILVSEAVVKMCTQSLAGKCRLIDNVIITGSVSPMELYVVDLCYSHLSVEKAFATNINWTNRQRYKVRQFLEFEKSQKWHEEIRMTESFNDNADIQQMRVRYTTEFMHVFNMGYQNYNQGEWQVAQKLLSRTKVMLGVDDGPSMALLKYMESVGGRDFLAPTSWKGIRELGTGDLS